MLKEKRGIYMKKLFLLLITIIIFYYINVSAASCDDVQCITCSYTIGNYEVVYNVTANGSGGATFIRSESKIDKTNVLTYLFNDAENAIISENFIKNSNQLYCPSTIYMKYNAGASTNVGVNLSFTKFSESKANASLNTANSTDNQKPFLKTENNSGKPCVYDGTMIQGTGNVPITITREGDSLKYELGNGYKVSNSEITTEDFPMDKEGTCPTIYIRCGSSGNDKYCYFYKDASSIDKIHGDNGQTGTDPVNPGQNNYDEKLDFNVSDDLDCDSIFSGRFGEFLKKVYNLLKFAVPIIILAFAIVDFIKAITAYDQTETKKAAIKLTKRLVIGVLIFVLPTILEFILKIAGIEFGTCGIK